MMCREPAEALQMLYLTMIKESNAVDTRALDVVEEHFGDRYQVQSCARTVLNLSGCSDAHFNADSNSEPRECALSE